MSPSCRITQRVPMNFSARFKPLSSSCCHRGQANQSPHMVALKFEKKERNVSSFKAEMAQNGPRCLAVQTRGHHYKLFKQRSNTRVRSSFFTERVINIWNSLPPDTVNFSSLSAFKRSLQLVNFDEFLQYSLIGQAIFGRFDVADLLFLNFVFCILQFVSHTGAIITIMPCCVRVNCQCTLLPCCPFSFQVFLCYFVLFPVPD